MKRKILLLICLILFIVSIAGVSAADDANQTIDDDANVLLGSADTLSVSQSDVEILGSADNGTFTDLQQKIDDAGEGAVINLENDYVADYSDDVIRITKTITINGNGYAIDGKGYDKIFYINSASVTLNNITLKTSYPYGNYGFGGAIYATNSDLTITNSVFTNHCIYENDDDGFGGAICVEDSVLTVKNSNFTNNFASQQGGAIYGYDSTIEIVGCYFADNEAGAYGGAIYSTTDDVRIINTTFINNSPNDFAPDDIYTENILRSSYIDLDMDRKVWITSEDISIGINLNDGTTGYVTVNIGGVERTLNLTDSSASLVVSDLNVGSYDVLVKYLGDDSFSPSEKSTSFKVVEATFRDLQELIDDADDGAIIELDKNYTYAVSIDNEKPIHIRKNLRINGNGYTLDANKENLIFDIDDCDVTLNNINFKNGVFVDYRNGGAIVIDDANVTIIDCNFADNGGDDEAGGVIYAVNTILTVSNSIFTNNLAFYGGGAILGEYSTVELNACEFTGNGVEYTGGAIDIYEGNLTVNDCSFTDNYVVEKGGAIFIDQGNLTVNACNFIDNRALMGEGGAIYTYASDLKVQDSSFENNTDYTSAIYMRGGKYDISNTTFTNNPNLTYLKLDIYLNVYNWEYTVFYPESQTVYIDTDRFDKYTVFINDEFYKVIEIKKDNYELVLNNLKPGDYKITVMFKGNDEFEAKNSTTYFNVRMLSPIELEIEKDIVITGENQSITVSLPKSATGDVQLWLNDDCYDSSEINNGQAVFNLTDLTADKYEVRVNYYGDEIYVSNSTGGEFHVLDPDTISVSAEDTTNLGTLHIDVYVGTIQPVEFVVYFDSKEYHAVTVYGHGWVEIYNIKTGEYEIKATYLESEATTTVNIRDATFTDLQNAIDALAEGETLYLNGDVKRTWIFDEDEWEDNPESEIHINKAITIDGMGYAIDGEEGGRIFNITSDNVILKNITFTNALPVSPDDIENEYNGGAVAIYANNVVISDCYFIGNGIDGPGDGGAIYCEGDLTVINSCFEENEISGDYYDDVNGAAISIVGDLTVINSNFTSNHVSVPQGSSNGGAIYSTGTVNISDSTFTGNYISGQYIGGGAVSAIAVNIENSVFNDNYVKASSYDYWEGLDSRGGAIHAGVVNVKNSDFTNNSASGYHSDDSYYGVENIVHGGAISSYDITNIENSNFKDNVADEGEALWAYALYARIDDTTFINNDYVLEKVYPDMSINISSHVFNVGDNVKIIVEFNNHVIGNVSIRVNDDEIIVKIIDDSATLTLSNMAKGTYKVNATLIENEYCEYDSAASKFKVIDVPFATFTELQELIDNASDGDTIYLDKYYIYDPKVDVDALDISKNITIIGNGNTIDGNTHHILDVSADNVVLKDIMFIDGYGMSAGAIYSYGNLDVINCIFENNTITERGIYNDYGGAIYSQGNLKVINSSFISNKAPVKDWDESADLGGAIASYGNLTVINSLFKDNAASFGGAIYADNVVAIDSTFINNTASRKPGAINAYNNLTLVNCTFENNTPNDYKRDLSIYIGYDESVYREHDNVTVIVYVYDNIKSVKIDVSGVVKTVDVVNETAELTLNDCDAGAYDVIVSYDGDDYYDSKTIKSSFRVVDDSYGTFAELSELIGNATDGEVIVLSKNYIYDDQNDPYSIFIDKNITIKGNGHIIDANSEWGAYFRLDADNILLDNLVFTNYRFSIMVESDSYGIEYPDANLTFTNCIFEDTRNAGNLIDLYHTNLTLVDSTLVNNEVYSSLISAPCVNVINSNFKNNTAKAPSTSVCSIWGYNITVTDSTFEDNTYAVSEGEIKVFDIYCMDTLFVDSSTFINNSTDMDDYIYVATDRKTVTNSKFIDKSHTPGTVEIDISASNINVGEDLTVEVLVSNNATGSVTLSINNNNQTKNLVDSKANFTVSGLAAGTYNIIVYYSGDDKYNASQESASVKVSKIDVAITITTGDINVGDNLVVNVSLTNGAVGDVVLSVGDKNYTATLTDSKATFTVSGLAAGKYDVKVNYAGNDMFNSAQKTARVNVNKVDINMNVSADDIFVGDELKVNVVLDAPATGQLNVTITGDKGVVQSTLVNIDAQSLVVPISGLKAGEYTVLVTYYGDDDYKPASANDTFKVSKLTPEIIIDAPIVKEGDDAIISVFIENATGNVLIDVNEIRRNATLKDNKATLTLSDLAIGTYNVTVHYDGNDILLSGSNSTKFDVVDYIYTYKDLQALIDSTPAGQTINLVRDYIYDASVDQNVITIAKKITINGNGFGVSGLDKAAIFKITADDVVLDNLTLTHANAEKGAAVFIASDNVIVKNSRFDSNKAENGAGIYTEGAKTSVINSVFTNNKASLGAGLYITGDDAVIYKCEFVSNEAALGAGGVSYGLRTNCTDSSFRNNTASEDFSLLSGDLMQLSSDDALKLQMTGIGAGLVIFGPDAVIDNSEFIGNDASEGAGLVIAAENCRVTNSAFNQNSALEGAGIVVNGTNATISESEFNGNDAIVGAGMIVKAENTTVSNSSFADNTAEIGTAILVEEEASLVIEGNDLEKDKLTVAYVSELVIDVNSAELGENVTINVTVKSASLYPKSGKVTIKVNNDEYVVDVEGSSAIKVLSGLAIGEYNVTAKYSGDVNHTASSASANFTVSKATIHNVTPEISGTTLGETPTVTLNLPEDATGTVTVSVNGKDYNATLDNGSATVTLDALAVGDYPMDIKYSGDDKYAGFDYETNISIVTNIAIDAPALVKYYHGPERFAVTLTENGKAIVNATVTINLNGRDYNRTTDENGVASMAINLNSGDYNVTVSYEDLSVNSTITVLPTVSGEDITKMFRNGTQYYATFYDTKGNTLANNTAVEFNINGVFYTRYTNEKGVARMNINLNPGEYVITAKNPNSTEQYTNIITVLPTIVENYDLTKYYKNASQYSLRILDEKGNPVKAGVAVRLNINGVFYTRTSNDDGYVKMNINLEPGEYTITAEYNGLMASNKIKVLSVIETHDLIMKYKDGSKFEAKILDGQGKAYPGQKVTFNINGVFYERITGDDGIARLNINLMAGEYIITSSYNGMNAANKVTISS